MKIEKEFLLKLLQPLENQSVPTLKEYLEELVQNGVSVRDESDKIDTKFEIHLNELINQGLISNQKGESTLTALGIRLGLNKHFIFNGEVRVKKSEANNQSTLTNNFNISAINADNVQVGNENTQNITITELVEKVAKSNDSDAKSTLKKLLENSTVGSVVGAAVSGLISLLVPT